VWVTVAELEQDLLEKIGANYSQKTISSSDFPLKQLNLEPGGQISVKIKFIGVLVHCDFIFWIIYFKSMQSAVCNEFMSRQGFQCTGSEFACHPRCYTCVITKCVTQDSRRGTSLLKGLVVIRIMGIQSPSSNGSRFLFSIKKKKKLVVGIRELLIANS
jgi:hypothetical protein